MGAKQAIAIILAAVVIGCATAPPPATQRAIAEQNGVVIALGIACRDGSRAACDLARETVRPTEQADMPPELAVIQA